MSDSPETYMCRCGTRNCQTARHRRTPGAESSRSVLTRLLSWRRQG